MTIHAAQEEEFISLVASMSLQALSIRAYSISGRRDRPKQLDLITRLHAASPVVRHVRFNEEWELFDWIFEDGSWNVLDINDAEIETDWDLWKVSKLEESR